LVLGGDGPRSIAQFLIPPSAFRLERRSQKKQGYTHKLIVPNVARLEAARSYIEETAERIDAGWKAA
jgi:hypothetical protein